MEKKSKGKKETGIRCAMYARFATQLQVKDMSLERMISDAQRKDDTGLINDAMWDLIQQRKESKKVDK